MKYLNLYKTESVQDNVLYKSWIVAENEQQVIDSFPKKYRDTLRWGLVDTDIRILPDL